MAGRDAPGSTTRAISGLRGDRVNPLRDPSDRRLPRVAGPCVLVMFGVTGDLSRKKLMPAVYDLANRGLLPPGFGLVGFARRDWEDEDLPVPLSARRCGSNYSKAFGLSAANSTITTPSRDWLTRSANLMRNEALGVITPSTCRSRRGLLKRS